mgnify:CR=1 FL=1|jgi:perosamine synthetase
MNLPLFKIYWDKNDVEHVNNKITSGEYWCTGKENEIFESKISEYLEIPYCISLNSGGSALHALMIAHGIGNGDEVIIPSFTFIATAYSPMYTGGKPVFADIEDERLGLDPNSVLEAITPKTKAIIPIHYGGIPCKIRELREIADDHNLILIEDAAEAFGAKIKDKKVGTTGDSSIFSFCHNKVFTTSEGGCIVTHDQKIYDKIKKILSYGRVSEGNYFTTAKGIDYVSLGYNWRLSSILAALGISQIEKIDELIDMRRTVAKKLDTKISTIEGISSMEIPKELYAVYQMYSVLMDNNTQRDKLIEYLLSKDIYSKIYFDPVHKYSVFKDLKLDKIDLPVTEEISSKIITLPFYPNMSDGEIDYLTSSLKSFRETF